MDARLTQIAYAQRAAAAQTVAGALAPRNPSSTARNAANAATTGTNSTGTTTATDPSAAITSSDFLTLLVSELQNQDPTQPTDPNEYITQLAQVNSLEQLISINSGIQTLDSSVPTSGKSKASGSPTGSSGVATPQLANLQPASAPAESSLIHKHVSGAVAP